jgi:hypothetical protein
LVGVITKSTGIAYSGLISSVGVGQVAAISKCLPYSLRCMPLKNVLVCFLLDASREHAHHGKRPDASHTFTHRYGDRVVLRKVELCSSLEVCRKQG